MYLSTEDGWNFMQLCSLFTDHWIQGQAIQRHTTTNVTNCSKVDVILAYDLKLKVRSAEYGKS